MIDRREGYFTGGGMSQRQLSGQKGKSSRGYVLYWKYFILTSHYCLAAGNCLTSSFQFTTFITTARITIMNKTRLSLIAASVILACNTAMAGEHGHGAAHWTYSGETGPEHWGDINPTCSAGVQQSPINNNAKSALEAGLDTIKFNYKSS